MSEKICVRKAETLTASTATTRLKDFARNAVQPPGAAPMSRAHPSVKVQGASHKGTQREGETGKEKERRAERRDGEREERR